MRFFTLYFLNKRCIIEVNDMREWQNLFAATGALMRMFDIIRKKRDGEELSTEEIRMANGGKVVVATAGTGG